ncbi:hypothetical protein E2C01_026432 [Portunus trituberculatus]|uniref:Uncharacterized protein n=1 Tax=Portunus trituberculatus TaxID=210409 RepID=A0A5B7EFD9_PORTR|nr:hypothetical protein [Portunus trituberculatus]
MKAEEGVEVNHHRKGIEEGRGKRREEKGDFGLSLLPGLEQRRQGSAGPLLHHGALNGTFVLRHRNQ